MSNSNKYKRPEFINLENRTWPDKQLDSAPIWCSVDLRDGNQALPIPMNPEKKIEYFKMLIEIGFKQIEVGFPSASQDDFDFVRMLIEENYIPEDVTVSVLTQAREHLIRRTVESLKGVKKAILHCYVATSDLHGKIVFNRDHQGVLDMAVEGTRLTKEILTEEGMDDFVGYEFSAEEFTDTEPDFAIEVCKAVKETWGPATKETFILNLPATVERRPPYQYADLIENFCRKYPYMDETCISIHAHNDQGCAVAASEMALMAGAERVEGTLFGHGERTGNLDIVTLSMNLFSRGIENKLDFKNLDSIIKTVEETSLIPVHPRHPYAGSLVFTAFSGSHQDAIRKGFENRDKAFELFHVDWKVPYLHIDPADVGRKYEKLIRINSQSGKGGAAYILEQEFGYATPKGMHPEIGALVQKLADKKGTEIGSQELFDAFHAEFIEPEAKYVLKNFKRIQSDDPKLVRVYVSLEIDGLEKEIEGEGNGPISATVHAMHSNGGMIKFSLDDFVEKTLGHSEDAKAVAYVSVKRESDGKVFYGSGVHVNIDRAAVRALFASVNRAAR